MLLIALLGLGCLLGGLGIAAPVAAAVHAVSPVVDELDELAAEARWDEVIAAAGERLAVDATDEGARYWLGLAWLVRAEGLLSGGSFSFAQDLARSSLDRAVYALTGLEPDPSGPYGDAREWWAYARQLRGDATLGTDLEGLVAEQGWPYGAYLRGVLARDEQDRTAVDWFRQASDADPSRALFALALAEAWGAAGGTEQALAAWERARVAGATPAELADAAQRLLPSGGKAEARLALLDRIAASSEETDGLMAWHRAWTLQQLGRIEQAEQALAAATVGRSPAVERVHAALLSRVGRSQEAADRLLKLVREQRDEEARTQLVDLADRLAVEREFALSLKCYADALEAEPNDDRALRNRALTLSRAGDLEASEQAWESLVERHPQRPEILNDAALCALGEGRHVQARGLLERAKDLYGGEDARENLAQVLVGQDPEQAVELLDTVLEGEPGRDRALYLRFLARCNALASR